MRAIAKHSVFKALVDPTSTLHKQIHWDAGIVITKAKGREGGKVEHRARVNLRSRVTSFEALHDAVRPHFKEEDRLNPKSQSPTTHAYRLDAESVLRVKNRPTTGYAGDLILELASEEAARKLAEQLRRELEAAGVMAEIREGSFKRRKGGFYDLLPGGLKLEFRRKNPNIHQR